MKKRGYSDFDRLSADDRRGIFNQAALNLGIIPANVEKDYWVCRVLRVVMKKETDNEPGRVFKGGTSLSKGFNIIRRFSEDIDIVIDREDLLPGRGNDIVDVDSGLSKRQRRTGTSTLRKSARPFLQGVLVGRIAANIPPECKVWVSENDMYGLNILVSYETLFPYEADRYSPPVVKVQPNVRAADFPTVSKSVEPYIGPLLPSEEWGLKVNSIPMITPQRTFWEKVMAVHARLCRHRDQGAGVFDAKRFSRHYYDLAMLYENIAARRALKDYSLLADVREHDRVAYAEDKMAAHRRSRTRYNIHHSAEGDTS